MSKARLSVDDAVVQDAILAVLRATDHAVEIPNTVMRDTLEAAFAAYNAKLDVPVTCHSAAADNVGRLCPECIAVVNECVAVIDRAREEGETDLRTLRHRIQRLAARRPSSERGGE